MFLPFLGLEHTALSSDFTMVDGTVFTGAKGVNFSSVVFEGVNEYFLTLLFRTGSTINIVDSYYTPGGTVTNGFDIQTPSAVHDSTTALSSDYTRVDGTVFTGEKGSAS